MDRTMNQCVQCPSVSPREDWDSTMNRSVGMAYVPWQKFEKTYDPKKALHAGTIFPELDKPFTGKCMMGGKKKW